MRLPLIFVRALNDLRAELHIEDVDRVGAAEEEKA
jgi:hypothetical protein